MTNAPGNELLRERAVRQRAGSELSEAYPIRQNNGSPSLGGFSPRSRAAPFLASGRSERAVQWTCAARASMRSNVGAIRAREREVRTGGVQSSSPEKHGIEAETAFFGRQREARADAGRTCIRVFPGMHLGDALGRVSAFSHGDRKPGRAHGGVLRAYGRISRLACGSWGGGLPPTEGARLAFSVFRTGAFLDGGRVGRLGADEYVVLGMVTRRCRFLLRLGKRSHVLHIARDRSRTEGIRRRHRRVPCRRRIRTSVFRRRTAAREHRPRSLSVRTRSRSHRARRGGEAPRAENPPDVRNCSLPEARSVPRGCGRALAAAVMCCVFCVHRGYRAHRVGVGWRVDRPDECEQYDRAARRLHRAVGIVEASVRARHADAAVPDPVSSHRNGVLVAAAARGCVSPDSAVVRVSGVLGHVLAYGRVLRPHCA